MSKTTVPNVEHTSSGWKYRTEEIPANRLAVDRRVQRELIPARVKKLANELDLDVLGVITVSERANGRLVAIDGQHRVAALVENGLGDWPCVCHVYSGLSIQDEAKLFRKLNDHRLVSPWDDFDKGLRQGDSECRDINRIVEGVGYAVSNQAVDGRVACIATLRKIYRRNFGSGASGGEVLRDALEIVSEAWGHTAAGVEKSVLEGVAIVAGTYNGEVDRSALVNKLSKFPGGASGLLGRARSLRDIRNSPVARLFASTVVALYNKGRLAGQVAEL